MFVSSRCSGKNFELINNFPKSGFVFNVKHIFTFFIFSWVYLSHEFSELFSSHNAILMGQIIFIKDTSFQGDSFCSFKVITTYHRDIDATFISDVIFNAAVYNVS